MQKEVCGINVVVPVGQSAIDYKGTIRLNGVANFIWDILSEGATEEEVLKKILGEYDVLEERAAADLHTFIKKLKEIKCIEPN